MLFLEDTYLIESLLSAKKTEKSKRGIGRNQILQYRTWMVSFFHFVGLEAVASLDVAFNLPVHLS